MEVMADGRNYFAREEREQPYSRALALERQQRHVPKLFREREQPDFAGSQRHESERQLRLVRSSLRWQLTLAQLAYQRREPGQQPAPCEHAEHAQR